MYNFYVNGLENNNFLYTLQNNNKKRERERERKKKIYRQYNSKPLA